MAEKNPFKHDPATTFRKAGDMSKQEASREAKKLREAISYHDHLYYVKNQPEISDRTYDKLFYRLQELEEVFEDLQCPRSPTHRVGAPPVDKLHKVEHRRPLLSLDSSEEESKTRDFMRFIHNRKNQKMLSDLRQEGVNPQKMKGPKSDTLKGLTFVFSGELKNFTRDEAEETVESLSGRAATAISGKTDYLVVGKSPGSKLEKAKKKGIKILNEKEFKHLLKEEKLNEQR